MGRREGGGGGGGGGGKGVDNKTYKRRGRVRLRLSKVGCNNS